MSNLFKDRKSSEVVTPKTVKHLTGITSDDFIFQPGVDGQQQLDSLLEQWIAETASNIHVRLGRQVDPQGSEAAGIKGVLTRTVANVIAIAHQQRSSPIIQLGEFATSVLNASDAFNKLDDELEPFIINHIDDDGHEPPTGSSVDVFMSSTPYVEPGQEGTP